MKKYIGLLFAMLVMVSCESLEDTYEDFACPVLGKMYGPHHSTGMEPSASKMDEQSGPSHQAHQDNLVERRYGERGISGPGNIRVRHHGLGRR